MVAAVPVRGAGALPLVAGGVGEEPPAVWRATGTQLRAHWQGDGLDGGSTGEPSMKDDA